MSVISRPVNIFLSIQAVSKKVYRLKSELFIKELQRRKTALGFYKALCFTDVPEGHCTQLLTTLVYLCAYQLSGYIILHHTGNNM